MIAEIVSVGTELLLGQIVDTNSQYLSRSLSDMGIDVYFKMTVGDNPERMKDTIGTALRRSDIVIATGGLGPTEDDITKEMVAELMNREMVMDEESLGSIHQYFNSQGRDMARINRKQALMPKGAIILPNERGTAPGCIVEEDGKCVIVLPGPPAEMYHMFETFVIPYLENLSEEILRSEFLRIIGMGESTVASVLEDLIITQTNPTIATYASVGDVVVRISAKCKKGEDPDAILAPVVAQCMELLGEYVYATGRDPIEGVVAQLLIEEEKTIALAESCTGGLIASMLVDTPGSSAFLLEGIVAYSNEAKSRLLQIDSQLIAEKGAVSGEVAREMAQNARRQAHADYGISVTGIAGPGGGTEDKPVGRVYIGLASEMGCQVEEYNFSSSNRTRNRRMSALNALNLLRLKVLSDTQESL